MRKQILSITFVLITFFSFGQVPALEREALINLYNSTNGANWSVNTNWNTAEPVSSWYHVTVETISGEDHVTEIILPVNNLNGNLPPELNNLVHLAKLRLDGNNLYGSIPDLSVINTLEHLSINNNDFQFADFEDEFNTYIDNILYFSYYPMHKLENEIIYDIVLGNTYTMNMPSVSGENITYQWYKNDEVIVGETGLVFTIDNAQNSDAANYTCKASSPIITDLIIERNTIHIYDTILEEDRNALVSLYEATNGANWWGGQNWNTSMPVYTWNNVEVEGNRVVGIDLSFCNLEGILPSELGNLSALKRLNLWSNNISGNIPIEIGNCENLTLLSLEDNQLTGNIPVEFANLTAMERFWINGNLLSGDVPDIFSNWVNLQHFSLGLYQESTNYGLTGDVNLSNNPLLSVCFVAHTNISTLNIKNGNNSNMVNSSFRASNNPNLSCVFVDDATYSNENWTHIDSNVTFVETQLECDALSTHNEIFKEKIKIFPNPNSGVIYFNVDENIVIKKILILNVLGHKIIECQAEISEIDISNLSNGIYYVNVESILGSKASYKVIKE